MAKFQKHSCYGNRNAVFLNVICPDSKMARKSHITLVMCFVTFSSYLVFQELDSEYLRLDCPIVLCRGLNHYIPTAATGLLPKLPTMFKRLTLSLGDGTDMECVIDWLKQQTQLEVLALHHTGTSFDIEHLAGLTSLTHLSFGSCKEMTTLQPPEALTDSSIYTLPRLRSLDLSGCHQLQEFWLPVMPDVQKLKLRDCYNLLQLPPELCRCTSLTSLDLSGCSQLQGLPDDFGNLTQLQLLDLTSCSSLQQPGATVVA
jgi:hypothetical protein